jgi:two-component system KDP operon response regulator KdpE
VKVLVFGHVRVRIEAAVHLLWADAEVIYAQNDQVGLDQFFYEEPDLVLIDTAGHGFDVLEAIRRVADTPVIMMTGRNSESDEQRALELGADDHVSKPFGQQTLVTRLRAVLRRAELPR